MMDLSIIIVSWNVKEYLLRCLASIPGAARGLSYEVFVVDNASTDGTAEAMQNLKLRIQNFVFITNKNNRGFAAANNQAIRKAKGKYILLLNPDTELSFDGSGSCPIAPRSDGIAAAAAGTRAGSPQCVTPSQPMFTSMLQFMESHPRCGVLGPQLLNDDRTLQPSVQRFPDAWGPLLFSLGITPGRYLATDFDYSKASAVDQVMGAAFLIRRELMDAIGMLDERFFIWFEEVDYCKRAKNALWEVWYTPDMQLVHHGGESFAQIMTTKKQWMYSRSLLQYFVKHKQWGAFFLNAAAVPFRLLFSIFK